MVTKLDVALFPGRQDINKGLPNWVRSEGAVTRGPIGDQQRPVLVAGLRRPTMSAGGPVGSRSSCAAWSGTELVSGRWKEGLRSRGKGEREATCSCLDGLLRQE